MLYVIIDIFGHLDEILRNKVGMMMLFDYYLCLLPSIFVQVAPVAVLLATVYTIGILNKYNEITAMKASGIGVFRIIRPFLLMGLLASVVIALVNERILPEATMTATIIKQDKIERVESPSAKKSSLIKDVALYGAQNRMFYAKSFDPVKKVLYDLIILEQDILHRLRKKITAKKAVWTKNKWVFYDCVIYDFGLGNNLETKPLTYSKTTLGITETPKEFLRGQFRSEHMSYETLKEYIERLAKVEPKTAMRLSVDLHYKTAFPFITFIIVFIGAAISLRARKSGVLFGIGMSVVISFIYYTVMAVSLAFGKGGWLDPLGSAWLANVVFFCAGILLLK